MEVELFIHGVPSGESFWGKNEDKNFFETFYDQCADEVKFVVQTRPSNGKLYCYYSYLVYKNVISYEGRSGSYFGMSLRLDAYCVELANIYRILDLIFNTRIKDNILIFANDKLKYSVTDFASVDSKLLGIQQEIYNYIGTAFTKNSFKELKVFPTASNDCPILNLYDCSSENVLSAVRQYGKIAISPYYQRKSEKELERKCEEKIQSTLHQCDAMLKEKELLIEKERVENNDKLSNANNQISSLNTELNQKKLQIDELQKKNSELNTRIQNFGKNKRIAELVGTLKQPVNELAQTLNKLVPESTSSNQVYQPNQLKSHKHPKPQTPYQSTRKRRILIISLIALLLIVLAAIFFYIKSRNHSSNEADRPINDESLEKIITPSDSAMAVDTCQLIIQHSDNIK